MDQRVAVDIEPLLFVSDGCDQEDLTTTTKLAPVSMAHLEQ